VFNNVPKRGYPYLSAICIMQNLHRPHLHEKETMKHFLLFALLFLCTVCCQAQADTNVDADTIILGDARYELYCYKNAAHRDSLWDLHTAVEPTVSQKAPCYRFIILNPLYCNYLVCLRSTTISIHQVIDLLRMPPVVLFSVNGKLFTGSIEALAASENPILHVAKDECLLRFVFVKGQRTSTMSREYPN